ncbi:MAG: pyridoxamine 5'-phosphate oxidase [Acidobacteriota bacterium]
MSIADLRREYASRALVEEAADTDPIRQFAAWFDEAIRAELMDANAMALATASRSGEPAARTVLLKEFDERGFVFYTNYDSAKGRDLAENARACLLFYWSELERQVRINGPVTRVTREESEHYFHSRPFESQVGAWASAQSTPIADRATLDARFEAVRKEFEGRRVPLPASWGGYRVAAERIEFWQGRRSRLHDRLLYTREADGSWSRVRLAP